jgi:branched-chain amino acid transport system ATP-binding protein
VVADKLQGGYGRKQVVFDASFYVKRGEVVSIVGHNGAGKTTVLKTIFGMLPTMGGKVSFNGEDVTTSSASANVKRGMSLIPAERFVFGNLSVNENLKLGALHVKEATKTEERRKAVLSQFPILVERNAQLAGTMSGGQQRMVSLGLALMSGPKLLLLDEPSLGLAPSIVIEIFQTIKRLAENEGLSVLILEQNIGQALRIADRFYAMRSGRIFLEETAAQMKARTDYWDLF